MSRLSWIGIGAGAAFILAVAISSPALAGEGGASFYLLGSGGPEAAILPPVQGVFFDNTYYRYSGDAQADKQFVVGGNLVAGLNATINADFVTLEWVPSTDFLGGTVGLGAALPVGRPDVNVSVVLTGPRGRPVSISARDAATIVADPVFTADESWSLGGGWHTSVTATVNVPIGEYREGQLANLSFHRWIVDTSGALTWHDEKSGWDVSAKAGFTFNGTNHYDDYKSGTDFHIEGSVEKAFSKSFSAGLQIYHLSQITGDSGAGATLGPNKGRVTGVGPTVAFNFSVGKTPVTLRMRYFEEFGIKRRLNGSAFFLSIDLPLAMKLPAAVGHPE
jgi:hypothetical protein